MAKLDFAFWDAVPESPAEGQTMADVYDDHVRLAQRIEEMGWHSYFTIEHQNRPGANITAPTVYLTAVARATSHLRLLRCRCSTDGRAMKPLRTGHRKRAPDSMRS